MSGVPTGGGRENHDTGIYPSPSLFLCLSLSLSRMAQENVKCKKRVMLWMCSTGQASLRCHPSSPHALGTRITWKEGRKEGKRSLTVVSSEPTPSLRSEDLRYRLAKLSAAKMLLGIPKRKRAHAQTHHPRKRGKSRRSGAKGKD